MSNESSNGKGWQHTSDSMVKKRIGKEKEGKHFEETAKRLVQADEDRNSVLELGEVLRYPPMVDEQDIFKEEKMLDDTPIPSIERKR